MDAPCRLPLPTTPRSALAVTAGAVCVLLLTVGVQAWELHGVLADHAVRGDAPARGWAFFGRIVAANLAAVALCASGLLTFGVGTLLLAPVVAAQLAILLATGRQWLSPHEWAWGLAVHGTGEVLAVLLGAVMGLYPLVRALSQRAGTPEPAPFLVLYARATAETLRIGVAILVVVLAAAAWETLVSVRL
ncbi:hypothetical protein MRU69_04465 [Kocuria flava]|uniref:hypothetical protein n=1 Tax=Kocuria flava TaxID=446860 RepID=UPI001FF505A5|nr:hypothetical protein [Kocuria flava]MCJ8504120.1 hypothetical protein [Kocuria flava]